MARFTWTALKNTTYPPLEEVRKAMVAADKPEEKQRDVRKLMALEMRMVEASPRLRGHLLTRRTALTSYDYSLVPDDKADADRATEALARIRPALHKLLAAHTDIPAYGCLALKLRTDLINGSWRLSVDRRYLPTEIERAGEDLQQVAVLQTDGGKIVSRIFPSEDEEGYWITGVDEETVAQGGILRSLVFHECKRQDTMNEWSAYNDLVKGILWAKYKQFAEDEDITVAGQAVRGAREHGTSVTSDAIEFGHTQTVSYLGSTSYKDFKATIEADEAIAILGQANTSELPSGGGSRAALEVLQLIRADIHLSDIVRMQRELAPQLLLADYRLNVDRNATETPWSLKLSLGDDNDTGKEVSAAAEAIESNIPLRREEVYRRIGYTMPAEGDDVITMPSHGVLPPGAPSGGPDG